MMHSFINVAGGELITYVQNTIPHFAWRNDVHTTVFLSGGLRKGLADSSIVASVESRCVFGKSGVRRDNGLFVGS
jgi:hypothetical protein